MFRKLLLWCMASMLLFWNILAPFRARAADETEGAQTLVYGGISYTMESTGTWIANGFAGESAARVTLPNTIEGRAVTKIADRAFMADTVLESVTIGSNITEIGDLAFSRCSALTTISGGAGVLHAGADVVEGTPFLQNCTDLIATIGNGRVAVAVTASDLDGVDTCPVPTGVVVLADSLFSGISSYFNITLPASLQTIGDSCFESCIAMHMPQGNWRQLENLTYIGDNAFSSCWALTFVGLCGKPKTIGKNAFASCLDLAQVQVECDIGLIPANAFSFCTALQQAVFDCSISKIGSFAFLNDQELQNVTIADTSVLTEIGTGAFAMCTNYTDVSIPSSVISVGADAYWESGYARRHTTGWLVLDGVALAYQGDEESVAIPDEVRLLAKSFLANSLVTHVEVPSTLTAIPAGAFAGCTTLESVRLPHALQTIGDEAFQDCTSLQEIGISSELTYLGAGAFSGCESLTRVTVESRVCTIADSADVFPATTTLWGYPGSTLADYAEKYNRSFQTIDDGGENQDATVPVATTTEPATTTITSRVTTRPVETGYVTLPLTATTETTTTAALPGDVDRDGTISVHDAFLVLRFYAASAAGRPNSATSAEFAAMDVTKDGAISVEDARRILLWYAKSATILL